MCNFTRFYRDRGLEKLIFRRNSSFFGSKIFNQPTLSISRGQKKIFGVYKLCESIGNILKRIGKESEENPLGDSNHAQRCPKFPHKPYLELREGNF